MKFIDKSKQGRLMKIFFILFAFHSSLYASALKVQLATPFSDQSIDITQYWVSEKYDGIRGYWTGDKILTRKGNIIHAPSWFTNNWSTTPMDGELWIKRNSFEKTMSCVLKKKIDLNCWQNVTFMVFDLPTSANTFTERINAMKLLIQEANSKYLAMIPQKKVASLSKMYSLLEEVTQLQGEGLMLHYGRAVYNSGRSQYLLKVKKRHDAEALVLGYKPGKGKYQGMMGALQVKTPEGIIFNIGTGFTVQQRKTPPAINTVITYQHFGKTKNGVPKFASFWRIREAN